MRWINRAIKDRYVHINKKAQKVVYLPQGKERNLDTPEEKVQLQTYLDLIYRYDYPPEKLRVCEKVKIGSSTREADIVVYRDRDAKDPFIIVECKKEKVSKKVFEGAVDQGFSYAAVTNAEFVWATSGDKDASFEVFHHAINERKSNRIARIPKHKEEKKWGYAIKRRLGWIVRHPIIADTTLFGVLILLSTLLLSKVAVEYHDEIARTIRPILDPKDRGLNLNWIFNTIALLATAFSMLLGFVFMQSHRLFGNSKLKKRLVLFLIAMIIFVPVWFIGTSNTDPKWWTEGHLAEMKYPILMYFWPYVKSLPIQLLMIYALIWLVGKKRDK